jgi:HSP20 family protein
MPVPNLIPWKRSEKKVPVKYEEQHPLTTFQQEINRLFDDFFSRGFGLTRFGDFAERFGDFSPQVDITETDKALTVAAELPGLDEKDVEVTLTSNALTISGEKKAEQEEKGQNYYRMERSYGSFRRTIPLPYEIEADKVEAQFKKGVLTITLPKTEAVQKQVKRITVKKV